MSRCALLSMGCLLWLCTAAEATKVSSSARAAKGLDRGGVRREM